MGAWEAVTRAWWPWMASMSVQLCVLVAVVALLDRLLRRWAAPELRLALWLVVIVKLLVPPTLASPVSVTRVSDALPPLPASPDLTASPTGTGWIFPTWLAGASLFALFAFLRWNAARRRWSRSRTTPAPERVHAVAARAAARISLRVVPPIRVADAAPGPFVFGVLFPRIILPASLLRNADERRLEHVLLHEMTHVKRRDPVVAFVCLVLQALYWFHPLVWATRRRLERLRELCCDEAVARALGEETAAYRRTLLDLARPMIDGGAAGACHFMHPGSLLLDRLERLERGPAAHPIRQRFAALFLCGALFACCVPLARDPIVPAAMTAAEAQFMGVPVKDLPGCLQLRYFVMQEMAKSGALDSEETPGG